MAIARAFSLLGTELTLFTLVFREKTQGPAAVAAIFIVGSIPVIIFSPLAGTIADRLSTRAVIPVLSVIGGAAVFAQTQRLENWAILTLLFVANTCASIIGPTWAKLTPMMATKEDISRATATLQTYFSLSGLLGPVVAGFLVKTTGFVVTFVIDGIFTTLIAILPFILGVNHKAEPKAAGEKTDMAKGFKFLATNKLLRSLVIMVFTMVLCLSVINVGDIFLLTDILKADSFIYGLVGSGFAIGTLLFSLAASKKKVSLVNELKIFGIGSAVLAISPFVVGTAPNYWIVMAIWFVAGMGNATINSYGVGMMIKVTPFEVQGRVFAAFGAIVSIAGIASMSVGGALVGYFGVRNVFIGAGIMTLVAFLVFFPTVYREQSKIIASS